MNFRNKVSILILASLTACGGGGGSGDAGTEAVSVTISGIVSDDPISGATVTATSLETGLAIGTAETAVDGGFSIKTTSAKMGAAYSLKASGGKMNGTPFSDTLSAIYMAASDAKQSNVTLITSSLFEAANSTVRFLGTLQQRHESIKVEAISRGVIPSDYFLIAPQGDLMARMQAAEVFLRT